MEIKAGDTLYARDGSEVVVSRIDSKQIYVKYQGKEYIRPITCIGVKLFTSNPKTEHGYIKEKAFDMQMREKHQKGIIDVNDILFKKDGKWCRVYEVHCDSEPQSIRVLSPSGDGVQNVDDFYLYQVGRDLYFEEEDTSQSPLELRKNPVYAKFFQLWDNSDAKIRFSLEAVPRTKQFEESMFNKVQKLLAEKAEGILKSHGRSVFEADFFASRGQSDYFAERDKISKQQEQPYFARVDYGAEKGVYIGKTEIPSAVIDWTDERAAFYYDYQRYVIDPEVALSLVRAFQIEHNKYNGFSDLYEEDTDTSIISADAETTKTTIADPYLLRILEIGREQKNIHDIISTIQANQYRIITSPFYDDAIVQGCAGSGKTMILYHRIKYILRNDRSIMPEQMVVLSPTSILKTEGDKLASSLEVNRIIQWTQKELYLRYIQNVCRQAGLKHFIFDDEIRATRGQGDLFDTNFVDSLANTVSAIVHDKNSQVYLDFIDEEEKLLIEKASSFTVSGKNTPFADVQWIIDEKNLDKISTLFREANAILSMLSPKAVEKEKERIRKQLNAKTIELQEIQKNNISDLLRIQDEISAAKSECVKREKKLREDLQLQNEAKETGNVKLFLKRIKRNSISSEDVDDLIKKEENDIKELQRKIKKLEQESEKKKDEPEKKQKELNLRIEESIKKQKILNNLVDLDAFDGEKTSGNMDSIYRFFAIFEENFPQMLNPINQKIIANPVEYAKRLSEVYISVKNLKEFENNKDSYMCFGNIVKYAIRRAKDAKGHDNSDQTLFDVFATAVCLQREFGIAEKERTLFFIDEFQSMSVAEFSFIDCIYPNAVFNLFGDYYQDISNKGITEDDITRTLPSIHKFTINENYRNAFEITQFVNRSCSMNMNSIGIHGKLEVKQTITTSDLQHKSKDRVAIIYKSEDELEKANIDLNVNKIKVLDEADIEIRNGFVHIISINDVKGLEFEKVIVLSNGMTRNEKYVAATRALAELIWVE